MALKGKVLRTVTVRGAFSRGLRLQPGLRRRRRRGEEDRQARRHRAAHRAALRLVSHHDLVDLAIRQANEKGALPGYEIVLAARGRHRRPGHRGQRRQQAGIRPAGRRSSPHAELQRLPLWWRRCWPRRTRPGPAGQRQPDLVPPRAPAGRRPAADSGRPTSRTATTDAFQGPFAADYALRQGQLQGRVRDPRQEDVWPGPRRELLQPVQGEGRPDRRDRHSQRERP